MTPKTEQAPIAKLVRQGFYAPTVLLVIWGPWITERSLLSRN